MQPGNQESVPETVPAGSEGTPGGSDTSDSQGGNPGAGTGSGSSETGGGDAGSDSGELMETASAGSDGGSGENPDVSGGDHMETAPDVETDPISGNDDNQVGPGYDSVVRETEIPIGPGY